MVHALSYAKHGSREKLSKKSQRETLGNRFDSKLFSRFFNSACSATCVLDKNIPKRKYEVYLVSDNEKLYVCADCVYLCIFIYCPVVILETSISNQLYIAGLFLF